MASAKLQRVRAVRAAAYSLHMLHNKFPPSQCADYCAWNEARQERRRCARQFRQLVRRAGYDPRNTFAGVGA